MSFLLLQAQQQSMIPTLVMFGGMGLLFYFLLIRPQTKRAKEHKQMVEGLKKGDEVVTGGGIRGRVTKVTDDEAEIEIAQGVRVRVVKATLSQVLTASAKPAND